MLLVCSENQFTRGGNVFFKWLTCDHKLFLHWDHQRGCIWMCHTDDENVQVSVSDCDDFNLSSSFFSLSLYLPPIFLQWIPLGEMEEQRFKVYCFPLLVGKRGEGGGLETQHWKGKNKREFSEDLKCIRNDFWPSNTRPWHRIWSCPDEFVKSR